MVPHRTSHWFLVALILLVALFTYREVHGLGSTDARASFEGRPAMAGAQAGQGALSGLPQGGLGVQGTEADTVVRPKGDRRLAQRDPGVDEDTGSTARTAGRSVRRAAERARWPGVAVVDTH